MKDAYSFHCSDEDLEAYYFRVHKAYERIFRRCGLKSVVSVMSDNGMFGGKFSHEFQLISPSGEDRLMLCSKCDYRANEEVAVARHDGVKSSPLALEKVHTPGVRTIDELSEFLGLPAEQTVKAVMFELLTPPAGGAEGRRPVVVFIRGDLEVVPAKLRACLGSECVPATDESIKIAGAVAGSTGPIGLDYERCVVVIDLSVNSINNFATGANESDWHLLNCNLDRDVLEKLPERLRSRLKIADTAKARPGDPCAHCAAPLVEARGIEVGNIFHLGTKYSSSMKSFFLDQSGKSHPHVMGCYGIGVTRVLASAIEESHDERGIIFPITISPFEVHLCAIGQSNENVRTVSEQVYKDLSDLGVTVLYDDRDDKAGSQFADADLIRLPMRLVVSPKTLGDGSSPCVEFTFRDNRDLARLIPVGDLTRYVTAVVREEYLRFGGRH